MEPLTGGFLKNIDETEFGGDIKLRRNGSQHAIPNPYYSTSEARSTCTWLCCGHVCSVFIQSKS
jgi:hypothetical protein